MDTLPFCGEYTTLPTCCRGACCRPAGGGRRRPWVGQRRGIWRAARGGLRWRRRGRGGALRLKQRGKGVAGVAGGRAIGAALRRVHQRLLQSADIRRLLSVVASVKRAWQGQADPLHSVMQSSGTLTGGATTYMCPIRDMLTWIVSYMRRSALKPSGCDSMFLIAVSVVRICSRISACAKRRSHRDFV